MTRFHNLSSLLHFGLFISAFCIFLFSLLHDSSAGVDYGSLDLLPSQHVYEATSATRYLEDPDGTLSIDNLLHDEIGSLKWQNFKENHQGFGFTDSTYWLKMDVVNHDSPYADYFLEVHYPLLDHVTFYLVKSGEVIDRLETGDAKPFNERPFEFRSFVYKPPLPIAQSVSLYVQARTQGSMLLPLRLWHEHDFYHHEQRELFLHGLYFGALLIFAFYNLLLFGFTRNQAHFFYTLYILTFGAFQISLLGIGYEFIWSESVAFQQWSVPVFMFFSLFATLQFSYHFLKMKVYCPWSVKWVHVLSLFFLMLIPLLPLMDYGIAIRSGLLFTFAVAVFLLVVSIVVARRGSADAWYFFFAWSFFLISVLFAASEKLGWGTLGDMTDHVVQLGVLMQVIVFTVVLAQRLQQETQLRIQLQNRTTEELALLVKERTLELEEANQKLHAISQTDGLTGVKNRRAFDEELERQFSAAIRTHTPISLLMIDIDFFKRLNDRFGHQVGDDYLRLIAAMISAEVKRPMDSVSRYGGEEFAVLLPQTEQEGAALLAECIRNSVETLRHKVGDEEVFVTVSLGVATVIPEKEDRYEELIKRADQALYQAKEQGRNRVVFY